MAPKPDRVFESKNLPPCRGGWLFWSGCPQAVVDAFVLDWSFLANCAFLWSLVLGCTIPLAAALSTRRVALLKAASRFAWSPFSASSNFLIAVFMADRCDALRTARSLDSSARLIAERFFTVLSSPFLNCDPAFNLHGRVLKRIIFKQAAIRCAMSAVEHRARSAGPGTARATLACAGFNIPPGQN